MWGFCGEERRSILQETERESAEESGLKGDNLLERRKQKNIEVWRVSKEKSERALFPRVFWMKCWLFRGCCGFFGEDLAHGNLSFGRNAKNQKASQGRMGEERGRQKRLQIPHEGWCSAKSLCGRIWNYFTLKRKTEEHGLGCR